MASALKVALIHLGRAGALGEVRRVSSWRRVLELGGAAVVELDLSKVAASSVLHPPDVIGIVRGRTAIETGVWSARSARAWLATSGASAAVCITTRAFHPSFHRVVPTVLLDFVDRLSVSYADRAYLSRSRMRRAGLQILARRQRRLEGLRTTSVVRTAAGWTDAAALKARWIPIIVDEVRGRSDDQPTDHDLVFVGTLSYPPNVDAVIRLAAVWPRVLARRPGTTLLLAGAQPSAAIRRIAADQGWTLCADFDDLRDVLPRGRLALAPLRLTAGIQIKVLDAAAHGVPQVATHQALRGYAPGWPGPSIDTDDELVDVIALLLDDAGALAELARLQRAALRRYTAEAWAPTAVDLLGQPSEGPLVPTTRTGRR